VGELSQLLEEKSGERGGAGAEAASKTVEARREAEAAAVEKVGPPHDGSAGFKVAL
jgi:hypothetical protein